jgi:hypothetical protein
VWDAVSWPCAGVVEMKWTVRCGIGGGFAV